MMSRLDEIKRRHKSWIDHKPDSCPDCKKLSGMRLKLCHQDNEWLLERVAELETKQRQAVVELQDSMENLERIIEDMRS